jgi:cytochrome c biogenesis protein CcdA
MIDAPLAFAFGAGLVAAFNPCGFAMLPAYLSYFLGADGVDAEGSTVLRALGVGTVVTTGFVAVFGVAGLLVVNVSRSIQDALPWLTLVIGLALVPLGIAMIRGFEPSFSLPRMHKGTSGRGLDSMFLFGVSYAVVSLSCTLPIFLAATATTFRTSNFISGMAVFFTYALGMGVVLLVLTMALALARRGLVSRMRTVLPHVNRISGVLLAAAGIYVAYYGFFELWVDAGQNDIEILGLTISGDTIAWPADQVTALSADLQNWVNDVGPGRLGLIGGGLIVVAVAGWYLWLTYRQPEKLP